MHGQVQIQGGLLEYYTNLRQCLTGLFRNVKPGNFDGSLRSGEQAREQRKQRRFARTIEPQKCAKRTLSDMKAHNIKSALFAKSIADVSD